jgi:hypothetical protein
MTEFFGGVLIVSIPWENFGSRCRKSLEIALIAVPGFRCALLRFVLHIHRPAWVLFVPNKYCDLLI